MKKLFNYSAHVNRVIDGDTVDATVDLGFNVKIDVRIRLAGINSPELKAKDQTVKAAAELSKVKLTEKVFDKDILLDSKGLDKYGRWIGEIHLGSINVNEQMVSEGYAVPYME